MCKLTKFLYWCVAKTQQVKTTINQDDFYHTSKNEDSQNDEKIVSKSIFLSNFVSYSDSFLL